MMVMCLSNTTTARLAGYARRRGLDIEVLISPSNAAGRYFVSVLDGKVLTHWLRLGWTKAEAEERIRYMASEEVSDGKETVSPDRQDPAVHRHLESH